MAYSNPDVKAAVLKAILSGMPQRQAAKKYGRTELTVRRWRKEAGVEISYQVVSTMTAGSQRNHVAVRVAK